MSIVLEKCTACDGTGFERFAFSDIPFHGGKLACWNCDGEGRVAVMQSVTELADDIFRAREERAMREIPTSVLVLRELGPLDLRAVTRETAKRRGVTLMYADVSAVLRAAAKRGEVKVAEAEDYRNDVWEAT